jgi:hypothetical protein
MKSAWYCTKTDMKTSGTEDPDMNPCSYVHLIFDKGAQNIMEKRQPLQQMLLGKLDICMQKNETRSMLITLY